MMTMMMIFGRAVAERARRKETIAGVLCAPMRGSRIKYYILLIAGGPGERDGRESDVCSCIVRGNKDTAREGEERRRVRESEIERERESERERTSECNGRREYFNIPTYYFPERAY